MKQKKEHICMILAICFLGVLLGELYLFKTQPDAIYILVAGLAVLLILTYFLSSNLIALHNDWVEEKVAKQEQLLNRLITELSNNKEDRTQETLANVEKFEKAIYLAVQQHTAKMQESFEHLDQGIAGDFDRLHNMVEDTKKSIAEEIQTTGDHSDKVYVKFSRENTKSLMVFQKKAFDNVMLGMEETVQEYTKANERTQAKLEELKQTLAHLNLQTSAVGEVPVSSMEDTLLPEDAIEEDTVPAESVIEEVPSAEELPVVENIPVAEDAPSAETPSPVNDDPNHVMTPEEIAALVAGTSEPAVTADIPFAEDAPAVETPSPVNDDPNHVMTPEEIAALVAGTSEPAVTADIPFAEETPAVETPSSVNDDPNHVMTPEEIAALIAGTQ